MQEKLIELKKDFKNYSTFKAKTTMKRKHSPTSKAAEEFIKPHKQTHYEKILAALELLRVGGTFEEISKVGGMKDSQVWKRLSELEADGKIFNTHLTRKLSSGVDGSVWQLTTRPVVNHNAPKTETERKNIKLVNQLSLL